MVSHIRKVFRQKKPNKKKEPYCVLVFLGSITSRTFLAVGGRIVLSLFFECFYNICVSRASTENRKSQLLYRQQQAMHAAEHVENQLNPSLPTSESAGLEEGKKQPAFSDARPEPRCQFADRRSTATPVHQQGEDRKHILEDGLLLSNCCQCVSPSRPEFLWVQKQHKKLRIISWW